MEKEIIKTIWNQIGGNRFGIMVGAKNLAGKETTLQFQFMKNISNSNRLEIKLEWDDTYTLTFGHLNKLNYIIDKIFKDVYCDELAKTFESYTGLYTNLGTMGATQ